MRKAQRNEREPPFWSLRSIADNMKGFPAMRAFIFSLALSFVVVMMVDTPRPATAQPSVLPLAQGHSVGQVEEVYYRRYGYRPYYGYGYRRHYYRPYYGYGYRRHYYRPYYGYGYRRHYYRRW